MEISALLSIPSILRQNQMLMGWNFPCAKDLLIWRPKSLEKNYIPQEKVYSRLHHFPLRKEEAKHGLVGHCVWRCCLLKEAYIFNCDPRITVPVRWDIFALLSSSHSSLHNYMVLTIAV